jgi:hypothetical protein
MNSARISEMRQQMELKNPCDTCKVRKTFSKYSQLKHLHGMDCIYICGKYDEYMRKLEADERRKEEE